MNRSEARYVREVLDLRCARGELRRYAFEPFRIRLAPNTFYRPDFLLWLADGVVEIHEIKGHWEDDARVKIKVAAALNPWWRFVAVYPPRSKNGVWQYEEIPPA